MLRWSKKVPVVAVLPHSTLIVPVCSDSSQPLADQCLHLKPPSGDDHDPSTSGPPPPRAGKGRAACVVFSEHVSWLAFFVS